MSRILQGVAPTLPRALCSETQLIARRSTLRHVAVSFLVEFRLLVNLVLSATEGGSFESPNEVARTATLLTQN